MKSPFQPFKKAYVTSLSEIVLSGLMAAILVISQVLLSPLANIELVSFLIIIYSAIIGFKSLVPIYVFVLIEGLIYGFGIWWISYLYIWTILAVFVCLFRKNESPLFWAVVSGLFGLFFGALCSLPYLFIGGTAMMFSYWISGIPYDIPHCIGNFVLALLLYRPINKAFKIAIQKII